MYYAGDIAELILAFAMVTAWRANPTGKHLRNRQETVPGAA